MSLRKVVKPQMLNRIIEWIKKQQVEDPKLYRMLKFLPVLVVFAAFYISGYFIQVFRNAFHPENKTSLSPFICLSYSVFSKFGWFLAVVLIVMVLVFLMAVNPKDDYRNPVAEIDEEGVARKEMLRLDGPERSDLRKHRNITKLTALKMSQERYLANLIKRVRRFVQ